MKGGDTSWCEGFGRIFSSINFFDASWKSAEEVERIGWSLHSEARIQKLQGSSFIKPTNTSLKPEAQALMMAVQQTRRLGYKQIAFLSDCKFLIDEFN